MNIAVLSCSAVGNGPIFYKWEKYYSPNSSWISPSTRAVNIASSVLKLSVVREEDEGAYRCVATNDDGSAESKKTFIHIYGECSAAWSKLYYILIGPPIVELITNYTVSLEGYKVSLTCHAVNDADAKHPLQINWYRDNKLVTQGNNRIIFHTASGKYLNSTLLFDPVIRTDDGAYTCQAFNRNDSFSESKAKLIVQCMSVKYCKA